MAGERKEFVLGGQAVIEGVMMKGPGMYAVAVRKASGEIRVKDFPIVEGRVRKALSKTPLVRGVATMAAMLVIGYRSLQYSADEAIEDAGREGKDAPAGSRDGSGLAMAGAMALAFFLGMGLFFWLPLVAARALAALWPPLSGPLAFNLVDGALRVLAFVGYVLGISLMKDIRRVFQYHGAEHKVVNAHEAKADLSPRAVGSFSCLHPRCGTSFLLFVMVISIGVFSLIPHESPLWAKAAMRVVLLPAIAGISYEVLRLTARRADRPLVKVLIAPGLLLQRLTTREPDMAQIEVAIASFRRVAPEKGAEAGLVG